MKKRRPLAKLIGDLASRPGGAASRTGRPATLAAPTSRLAARKPPARVDADTHVVPASPRRLQKSSILAELTKTARADGRRRTVASRPSRRSSRAS